MYVNYMYDAITVLYKRPIETVLNVLKTSYAANYSDYTRQFRQRIWHVVLAMWHLRSL